VVAAGRVAFVDTSHDHRLPVDRAVVDRQAYRWVKAPAFAARQTTCCGLDLDLGSVSARRPQRANKVVQFLRRRSNVTNPSLHFDRAGYNVSYISETET